MLKIIAEAPSARRRTFVLLGVLGVLAVVFVAWRHVAGGDGKVDRDTARRADEIKAQVMEPEEPAPPDPSQPAPQTDTGITPTPVKKGNRPPG